MNKIVLLKINNDFKNKLYEFFIQFNNFKEVNDLKIHLQNSLILQYV